MRAASTHACKACMQQRLPPSLPLLLLVNPKSSISPPLSMCTPAPPPFVPIQSSMLLQTPFYSISQILNPTDLRVGEDG